MCHDNAFCRISVSANVDWFYFGANVEDNFARAMNLTDGKSFMWERPMTAVLLIFAVALIFLPSIRELYSTRLRKGK